MHALAAVGAPASARRRQLTLFPVEARIAEALAERADAVAGAVGGAREFL